MKISPSHSVTTTSEAKNAILDWVKATEEFHGHYKRIGEILQEKGCSNYTNYTSARVLAVDKSGRITRLGKLRQHMSDVLETLLVDMNNSSDHLKGNTKASQPSKAGKLMTHARLLKDINQKVSQELLIFNAFQA